MGVRVDYQNQPSLSEAFQQFENTRTTLAGSSIQSMAYPSWTDAHKLSIGGLAGEPRSITLRYQFIPSSPLLRSCAQGYHSK
jgi:hypothetical protein